MQKRKQYTAEFKAKQGVWNLLKRRKLKNVCCQTLEQLDRELLLARALGDVVRLVGYAEINKSHCEFRESHSAWFHFRAQATDKIRGAQPEPDLFQHDPLFAPTHPLLIV